MIVKVWNLSKRDVINVVIFDQEKKVFTNGGYTANPEMEFEVRTSYMVDNARKKLRELGYREV